MAHQTKVYPMSCGRLYVTEKFCTIHNFAKELLVMSDGEAKILGTIRMNVVNSINRTSLKKPLLKFQHIPFKSHGYFSIHWKYEMNRT